MKKLKDLLNEAMNPTVGKVYSDPYATSFVKEQDEQSKESDEFTSEQREVFLEAVKQYKKFGESIYRKSELKEVCNSIKGLVEVANKVTIKETGDWFDGVTVSRHMKRMNESYRVFEKTLTEVATLQQRMESSYDEIGEVLGKYYEIHNGDSDLDEGNEFGAARAKAIANGSDSFEVDGETFPVKDVDSDDKENAKEFAKESVVNEGRVSAVKLLKLVAAGKSKEVEGIKLSKEMAEHYIYWINTSAFGKAYGTLPWYQLFSASFNWGIERGTDKLLKKELMKLKALSKKVKSNESVNETKFIAFYNNKQHKIEGKDLWDAKLKAIKQLKIPKSKQGLLAIKSEKSMANQDFRYESVNEGSKNVWKSNDTLYVDTDFVNACKGKLPHSELKHMGGGDFMLQTEEGNILFIRTNEKFKNQSGRAHKIKDNENGKLVAKLIKAMSGKIQNEAVNEAVAYDIGMARKGNGITIYNKAVEENGDFKNIAHIDNKGNVKFFDKKLPSKIKKMIELEANKMKESVNEIGNTMKLKDLIKESIGLGDLPSSKLMKMKMTLKELEESEKSEPSMKLASMVSNIGTLPSSKLMKMKMTLAELEASERGEVVTSLKEEQLKFDKLNEGFAMWEMSFAAMTLSGVKLDPKKKYKVKARNTVEAIKKASKMAGLTGSDWMATQTNSLKKIG